MVAIVTVARNIDGADAHLFTGGPLKEEAALVGPSRACRVSRYIEILSIAGLLHADNGNLSALRRRTGHKVFTVCATLAQEVSDVDKSREAVRGVVVVDELFDTAAALHDDFKPAIARGPLGFKPRTVVAMDELTLRVRPATR
jgi:hypothetical protein